MEDIVPALYEKIHKEFIAEQRRNGDIRTFTRKMKDETALPSDVSEYSGNLGKCASVALAKYLIPEELPDQTLYWNIAYRTVRPLLMEVFDMVMDAAEKVQKRVDKAAGISLNSVRPAFPEERVRALINSLLIEAEEIDEETIT